MERDEPRVASNAAWIILNIAESFEMEHDKLNNELDVYVEKIISGLFHAASREDASEHHLQASSYEAFVSLVHSVSMNCQKLIFQVCLNLIQFIRKALPSMNCSEYPGTSG